MIASTPNPAWPLPSDAENAGRALALRAALDFALSPQQQRRGMLPTEERVLELADKFAAWLDGGADSDAIDLDDYLAQRAADKAQHYACADADAPTERAKPIVAGMDVASKSEMVSLHVSIRPAGLVEATESVEALQKAVRSGELADASLESIKALLDLASVDLSDLATFGADKLSLHFQPTEQYLRCVAAIAARDVERHVIRVEFRHGWPILSVESRFPTVAEGAAPANAAPEAAQ